MRFAIYSEVGEQSIRENLGRPEYSYYFVLKSFLPALERIGAIEYIRDPAVDLDRIFADCATRGEPCLFISFSPPHKAFIDHAHPMVVVFAWEFSTIPDEVWDDDPRNDWRIVFARHGRAVTLSNHTARAVKAAMGRDFPILAVAAPVWDRFESVRAAGPVGPIIGATEIRLEGLILDSRTLGLSPDYLLLPEPPIPEPPRPEPVEVEPESIADSFIPPEPVAEQVEPVAVVVPEAEPEPEPLPPEPEPVATSPTTPEPAEIDVAESVAIPIPPRKTFRYRLGITKRYALQWYREAVRDLLPRWLVWIVSRVGRLSYWLARLMVGSPPAPAVAPPPIAAEPAIPEMPEIEPPPVVEEVAVEAVATLEEDVPPETDTEEPQPVLAEEAEPDPETVEVAPPPPPPAPKWSEARVTIDGVVYTSVLNPTDGRKNYKDLITAFCWAFRDVEDATLVLKMVQGDLARWYHPYIQMLSQLSPFKCRVVALHGYLGEEEYRKMIEASTYYVNASCCEGLCLPLMEFMSCRRPAVAPDHTAMGDYIDSSNAFVVRGSLEHNVWPHDPRDLFRTERYRIDWESLLNAYQASYRVAKESPDLYAAMGKRASEAMRVHNSDGVVADRLERFLAPAFRESDEEARHVPAVAEKVFAE